jgi:processive 1,2-diacylglycerol beta-glucosyltransferase
MRVLILFCEEGEGHASAARVLERELAQRGAEVVVVDAMQGALGRFVPLVSRDAYHLQTRLLRWSYGIEYFLFTRVPPTRWLGRRGLSTFAARPLRRLIRRVDPDIVVSTHPAVTNVLGFLRSRSRRRLELPVVATITDLGVHALWAHPGIDLHLVMHDAVVPDVEAVAGKGSAAVVAPIVAPEFGRNAAREDARATLGFPPERPLVLVSGGGWGVGALDRVTEAALAAGGATVVCLTGRNELLRRRLERRFANETRLHLVPFTTRMPEYLAAADLLVDASVGVTCLEALQAGCAVIACGTPPGHSRDNARALARLGLAQVASTPRELPAILASVLGGAAVSAELPSAPAAADAILGAQPRTLPSSRRRLVPAVAAASLGALVLAGWTFASPMPYPVVARVLDLEEMTGVQTQAPDVAVVAVVPTPRLAQLAGRLAAERIHVSFAVATPPSSRAQRIVVARGDELLPDLTVGGARGLLHARTRLLQLRQALGLGGRFYYLAPPGFSVGDYVAARTAGGLPLASSRLVAPGSIVVVYGERAVTALVSSLGRRGLRAVTLSELLASRPKTRPTGSTVASASAPPPVARMPMTSPAVRSGEVGHHSCASSGARATGTKVVSASTSGAT